MVEKTPFTIAVKKIKHIGINICTNLIPRKLCKSHTRKNLKSSQETKSRYKQRHSLFLDRMIQYKNITVLLYLTYNIIEIPIKISTGYSMKF